MQKVLCTTFLLSALISCSSTKISVDSVKEINRYEVEKLQCRNMDNLTGFSERGAEGEALRMIVSEAAEKGYRYYTIEERIPNGAKLEIKAIAYDCKK